MSEMFATLDAARDAGFITIQDAKALCSTIKDIYFVNRSRTGLPDGPYVVYHKGLGDFAVEQIKVGIAVNGTATIGGNVRIQTMFRVTEINKLLGIKESV